jgi:hypothetical protein
MLESRPIELGSLPTRVFGIGMHKTGTTSLHRAFQILGLDAAHWITAHWAKAIWVEMRAFGKSPTLERHYALSDLPISILYRELDEAYPGSKFVLTTRREEDWIASVERHWSYKHNRFRSQWDMDPFTHQVHQAVYGRKRFDAEVFLARFRRHNEEVRCYFKGRREDLLVMSTDEGTDWLKLCAFLRKPIPAVPYPCARSADF